MLLSLSIIIVTVEKPFHFSVDPVHVADSLGSGPFYNRDLQHLFGLMLPL